MALLYELLENLIKQQPGQKFILLSKEKDLPEIFGKDVLRTLDIPQSKSDAVIKKVNESFPDTTVSIDSIMKTYTRLDHSLSSLFFHFWNLKEDHFSNRTERPEWVFLQNQDIVLLEILYICLYGRFFITRDLIISFFEKKKIPAPEVEERLKRLENLSFIRFNSGSWRSQGTAGCYRIPG